MAYIDVNLDKFNSTAASIDNYVSTLNEKMNTANNEVSEMSTAWEGDDYNAFKTEWDTQFNDGSTYKKMVKSLEEYSNLLRYAGKQYADAQNSAIERANGLTW